VIWLTGPPAAGKTTLARLLEHELKTAGRRVEVLDGDEVRATMSRDLGFSRRDRDENVRRVAEAAAAHSRAGAVVIVALVSPHAAARRRARRRVGDGFLEVHVRASLKARLRRDPKGQYARALAGELPAFTGLTAAYEPPAAPELVIDTDRETPRRSARRLRSMIGAGPPSPSPSYGDQGRRRPEGSHP
jgi:adenylyl-sulfate kinase